MIFGWNKGRGFFFGDDCRLWASKGCSRGKKRMQFNWDLWFRRRCRNGLKKRPFLTIIFIHLGNTQKLARVQWTALVIIIVHRAGRVGRIYSRTRSIGQAESDSDRMLIAASLIGWESLSRSLWITQFVIGTSEKIRSRKCATKLKSRKTTTKCKIAPITNFSQDCQVHKWITISSKKLLVWENVHYTCVRVNLTTKSHFLFWLRW